MGMDQKFVVLVLRNAKLSTEKLNDINFMLKMMYLRDDKKDGMV